MHLAPAFLVLAALTSDSLGQQPPPIVNGETTGDWPAVGMIAAYDADNNTVSMYCSGTLVANQAVVTAGHCDDAAQTYLDWGYDTVFIVGSSLDDIQDVVLVDGWEAHPDYLFDDSGVAADVAVATLSTPLSVDIAPLHLRTADLGTDWYDQDLTLVGYGVTSDGSVDAGTKRTTTVPVYTLDSDFVYGLDETVGGSNACSGDSGGAALRQTGDGWELVGVLSFVFSWQDAQTSCVGGGVGATRMDVFGEWVAGVAGLEAGGTGAGGTGLGGGVGSNSGGGGVNPFVEVPKEGGCCATAAPRATLWGLLLGLTAMLTRRRSSAPQRRAQHFTDER
ncbi:MAG: trypsin-like serine protease [Oligoflexia bacterium]|nr:trypsin-like serine protease [Oligoflexia bacterium]